MKLYEFNVKTKLPEKLKALETIAYNLWWSWDEEARELFKWINPEVWVKSGHNPISVISNMVDEDFARVVGDPVMMSQIDAIYERLREYISLPKWFDIVYGDYRKENMCVAYFSAEYGIHESVRLYSGGLGILSGDHCKSASDLGIPFVAVGLLYRNGYFHQYLNSDGWQQEFYPYNEFYRMPLRRATDEEGNDLYVEVKVGKDDVKVAVWIMKLGTIQLIFLDTDVIGNNYEDRMITGQLYGGDTNMRIRQEIILGIAGYRALEALKIQPTVYHINEGHPSFMTLERIRKYVSEGLDLRTAAEVVKKTTLFTTHTPVPAGFDVFSSDQIKKYLGPIFEGCGFNVNQLMGFGRKNPFDESEGFAMAICGIKLSTYRNGVSKLHGAVSREMFKDMWPNCLEKFIPVGHVTNGIHLPTFISEDMKTLYDRYLTENWRIKPYDFSIWSHADTIPDAALFAVKRRQRERLVIFTRKRLRAQILKRGGATSELVKAEEVLQPDVLTIGFARRFATYKRAYLLFMDEARLNRILNNPEKPVQIIIAGKAHPRDNGGKEIIKKIFHTCRKPEFRDKVVFLEDYDHEVGRTLAAGVDVWLNNPRRPMEASGTSGMKISANAGLNLSILDGWWDEGYNGSNGWAIGAGEQYDKESYQDHVESMELYDKLENELIHVFYNRDRNGVPRDWVAMMKSTIKSCPSFFNTSRMVMDYTEKYYLPLHDLGKEFTGNGYDDARGFIHWKDEMIANWDSVQFVDTVVETNNPHMGSKVNFKAKLALGNLAPENIDAFAVVDYNGVSGVLEDPEFVKLDPTECTDGVCSFSGKYSLKHSGKLKIGFAAVPAHKFVKDMFDLNQVRWAK